MNVARNMVQMLRWDFFLVLQELTFTVADIFFICFRCYVFILWWSDGASDGSNVQALALPIKISSLYGTSSAPHMLIGKDVHVSQWLPNYGTLPSSDLLRQGPQAKSMTYM